MIKTLRNYNRGVQIILQKLTLTPFQQSNTENLDTLQEKAYLKSMRAILHVEEVSLITLREEAYLDTLREENNLNTVWEENNLNSVGNFMTKKLTLTPCEQSCMLTQTFKWFQILSTPK